jgi:hypothetical protein
MLAKGLFSALLSQPGFYNINLEDAIMSFFGKILEKLGFGQAEAAPATEIPVPNSSTSPGTVSSESSVKPMSSVDVVSHLDQLAASNPQKLNWKTSIVDLLKLLNLDSGLEARKELATELGCPADKMSESAQMNMWLHKAVLQKLAENGGNIPKELL